MRTSSFGAFQQGLRSIQLLHQLTQRTQRQIASGQRILTPSDDPISALRALEMRDALSRLDQFNRNGSIVTNRLQDEEVALEGINNTLQRVRELALQANNATQSDETRALLAVEMRQHLDQLVQLANQKDGNGRFLFAGNLDATTPVGLTNGVFVYNGDQGHREIQIGESRTVADGDAGADVFFQIRQGNGSFVVSSTSTNTGSGVIGGSSVVDPSQYDGAQYTVRFLNQVNYEIVDSSGAVIAADNYAPGKSIGFQGIEFTLEGQPVAGDEFVAIQSPHQDVFTSVQKLISAVDATVSDDASRADLYNGINSGLNDIDQAIGKMLNVRTRVGSRLSAIENQQDSNGGFALTLQQTIGQLEDLDYAEALSRLSFELLVLESAQKSFIRTQSQSLFDFL
jgi:flagellar hook-associated protein 3 FlgL